jgi:ABC-type nickel/cobalt efflux system permease component RcnA
MSGLYVNVQLYLLAIAVPFVGLVALFLVRRKWRSLNMARHNESPGHRKERPLSFTDFLQQAIFNGSDTLHERQTDRREMEELLKSKKKKHKHKKSSKFKKITMPE